MTLEADVSTSPKAFEAYLRASKILRQGVLNGQQLMVARTLYEEAIALLRERETHLCDARAFAASLRALVEGAEAECLRATEQAIAHWADPEGRYYLATHFARFGRADRALAELNASLDRGFIHYRRLARDPFLDGLRGTPGFEALRERAGAKYRHACVAFADAGGQRLFGL